MTIFVASCGAGKTACHIFKGGESQCIDIEGQKKCFVNIKVRLGFKKYCMWTTSHLMLKKTARLFQYFTSLTQWMHGALHQPAFRTGAIVPASLHAFIWHLLCISNAERPLQRQRRGKFVFCNTKLWCLPTNKLAVAVTSNGRWGEKKRPKPKCFLIGPLGHGAKVQHWLSKYAVKRETFTMATSVSAKHVL